MITWTDSALAALENHTQRARPTLIATGADPDEVAADLRRHIEEELTGAKIHIATRDEVQRVLGQMGANRFDAEATQPRRPVGIMIAAMSVLLAALIGGGGYLYLRPSNRNAIQFPPEWFLPTNQDPAGLVNSIALATNTPDWGRFRPGDSIMVTSVRGDRKTFEVGGRYLIEGNYKLSSLEAANLSVSVTATQGVGGISPAHSEEGILVHRGTGHFALIAKMRYPGHFHISLSPPNGGQSRGTVYFDQADALSPSLP